MHLMVITHISINSGCRPKGRSWLLIGFLTFTTQLLALSCNNTKRAITVIVEFSDFLETRGKKSHNISDKITGIYKWHLAPELDRKTITLSDNHCQLLSLVITRKLTIVLGAETCRIMPGHQATNLHSASG